LTELRRTGAFPDLGLAGDLPLLKDRSLRSHRDSLLDSIACGQVPLKFAYAGSGADAHRDYAATDDYIGVWFSAQREADTLIATDMCAHGLSGVVEVGPGDGLRSIALLDRLRKEGLSVARYLGLDFSAELLRHSSRAISEHFAPGLRVYRHVWDMEDAAPSTLVERWRRGGRPVLACLLGHTLGNFEDPVQAMRNLAALLRPGDVLLASVMVRPAPQFGEISNEPYRTEKFRRAALAPMIDAGISPGEMEFTVEYRDNAFIGEVTLPYGTRLGDVVLPRGHRFRCFMSRRFDVNAILRLFEKTGWSVPTPIVDPGGDHMTVVASRIEEPR